MITCNSFNPCEMDYASWLTVAGFIMTILLLFMNEVLRELSVIIDAHKSGYIKNYYAILGIIDCFLIIIVIASILCFIFHKEQIGATLVTCVLWFLFGFSPTLLIYKLSFDRPLRQNSLKKNDINKNVSKLQPGIDY